MYYWTVNLKKIPTRICTILNITNLPSFVYRVLQSERNYSTHTYQHGVRTFRSITLVKTGRGKRKSLPLLDNAPPSLVQSKPGQVIDRSFEKNLSRTRNETDFNISRNTIHNAYVIMNGNLRMKIFTIVWHTMRKLFFFSIRIAERGKDHKQVCCIIGADFLMRTCSKLQITWFTFSQFTPTSSTEVGKLHLLFSKLPRKLNDMWCLSFTAIE